MTTASQYAWYLGKNSTISYKSIPSGDDQSLLRKCSFFQHHIFQFHVISIFFLERFFFQNLQNCAHCWSILITERGLGYTPTAYHMENISMWLIVRNNFTDIDLSNIASFQYWYYNVLHCSSTPARAIFWILHRQFCRQGLHVDDQVGWMVPEPCDKATRGWFTSNQSTSSAILYM